jgi:hypothetical protein
LHQKLERIGSIHGFGAIKCVAEDAVSQTRKSVIPAEVGCYRSATITRRGWGHLSPKRLKSWKVRVVTKSSWVFNHLATLISANAGHCIHRFDFWFYPPGAHMKLKLTLTALTLGLSG